MPETDMVTDERIIQYMTQLWDLNPELDVAHLISETADAFGFEFAGDHMRQLAIRVSLEGRWRKSQGWPSPTTEPPSIEEVEEMEYYHGTCWATDGCTVEPDGICEHGHPSWLLVWGVI